MKDKIENILGYALILFVYFLCAIFGFERIKKFGYCILTKFEDKPCDMCEKTNIFRSGDL